VGLVLGFTLWFFGFMTVGAEWFLMWQSQNWNGQQAAFRIIACIGIVLVFLGQRDAEPAR
jgi:predicted small integral membrane protein